MAYVAAALTTVLSEIDWTQRDLAQRCGLPASQINRYCRGVNKIPIDSAEKLIRAIPEEHRATILIAYLRDCIPPGFENLVEVASTSPRVKEEGIDGIKLPKGMDAELTRMIELFGQLGMRHTQVRDMMRSFLKIAAPEQMA